MITTLSMFLIFVSLFFLEIHEEKKEFKEQRIRDNENILIDIERFLNSKFR